ncbi:GGDEF domain-containing protein [Caldimonas thermodepolymerans]|uniref:diguanylate cyclase n=1 Tax=Caldimonas thermodepolymerans TaxID=215580 RepID=A0AA46DGE6_9BURK|nr:GGDEF domain-containing protein [Caldimonas thermodepolymerans]TCP08960.1 diguanylate cyclase [Caldimonas thermodepolymerans]UZG47268.1 GGDEF domain-containing protein [Caldimonas thermodepolymerans]
MDRPSELSLLNLRDLDLEQALSLLEQAGHPLPPQADAHPRVLLQAVIDGLCDLSLRDALTGLANRRHFRAVLEREIDRVARTGEAALLLILDIDHFKHINDTYGHEAGDQVIQAVGRRLAECVRPMDTVARYGGEEFAIVLPNCQPAFGLAVAERMRQAVQEHPILLRSGHQAHVTVSLGGAFAPQWVRSSVSLWMERADLQLYCAKTEGRNRVCLEETPASSVTTEEKSMLFGVSLFSDLEVPGDE